MEIPVLKAPSLQPGAPDPSEKPVEKTSQTKRGEHLTTESIREISIAYEKSIEHLVENLNQIMEQIDYHLKFIPDREAGMVIIKVLDGNGKVIRQIPPEAILSISSRIGESIGILINSKL